MKDIIYVAGGCFWGVQAYYDKLKGVISTKVGYANGNIENPKYEQLKRHEATHVEAVEVIFDNDIISLEKILEHLLRIIDPYELNHQGEDFGIQYRTGVYYLNNTQEKIVKEYFKKVDEKNEFKVELLPLIHFYDAETYHQKYLEINPNGYCHINFGLIKDNEKKWI